jgi:hypothetical protein
MKATMVINEETSGKETYYSVSGEAGKHRFFRFGAYATKEKAQESADHLAGWANVNILEGK